MPSKMSMSFFSGKEIKFEEKYQDFSRHNGLQSQINAVSKGCARHCDSQSQLRNMVLFSKMIGHFLKTKHKKTHIIYILFTTIVWLVLVCDAPGITLCWNRHVNFLIYLSVYSGLKRQGRATNSISFSSPTSKLSDIFVFFIYYLKNLSWRFQRDDVVPGALQASTRRTIVVKK